MAEREASDERPALRVTGLVLDTPDPVALGAFYARLLGWSYGSEHPGWVVLRDPRGGAGLSFQREDHYVAPVWPAGPDDRAMMAHLDVEVEDLRRAVAWVQECGATVADHQPQEHVRVCLDPDGHPFCLYVEEGQERWCGTAALAGEVLHADGLEAAVVPQVADGQAVAARGARDRGDAGRRS